MPPVRTRSSRGQRDGGPLEKRPVSWVEMLTGMGGRQAAATEEAAGQAMDEGGQGTGRGLTSPQPSALQPWPFPLFHTLQASGPGTHSVLDATGHPEKALLSSTGPGHVPSDQSPIHETGLQLPFIVRGLTVKPLPGGFGA